MNLGEILIIVQYVATHMLLVFRVSACNGSVILNYDDDTLNLKRGQKSKSLAGQYSKVLRASYISTIDFEIKCELEMTKTLIKILISTVSISINLQPELRAF